MATNAQIRNGIKGRLDTISGLNAHADMPGALVSPAAVVSRRSTTFDTALGGEADDTTWTVTVTVFIEWTTDLVTELLDPYIASSGASSIRAAIDGDRTLGGVVDWAHVTGVEGDRPVEWPPNSGITWLAADVVIEVG